MVMVTELIDLLFVCGMLCFFAATVRQILKVYRVKKTSGISLTHYKIKLVAITFMTVGYILSILPLSIIVSTTEGVLNIVLILMVTKYRKEEDERMRYENITE